MKSFFILILCLLIIACLGSSDDNFSQKKIVSLIIDGGFNDKSFNESAWNGIQKLKQDVDIEIIGKDSNSSSYLSDFEGLKDKKSDFIWSIGYRLQDATFQAALLNRNIKYGAVDITYSEDVNIPENLLGVYFKVNEASFLSGYVAAKTTKTGKIGFIGGIKGKIIDSFRYGYEAGARYANKDIIIMSQYIGSFVDLGVGSSMAKKMYQDGVDIIFSVAGIAGVGAIEAAKELGKGHYIIGVDQDQSYLAPENVITSVIKNVGLTIYQITKTYLKTNSFKGGKVVKFGLKTGAVNIVENHPKIKFLKNELASLRQSIINESILVPNNEKGL